MRILQLSTHTTLAPHHGGKLRSHHIGRVLEEAGLDLRRLALCVRTAEDQDDEREPIVDVGRSAFWYSASHRRYGRSASLLSGYVATVAAMASPGVLDAFDRAFRHAAPDVVLLEHPWTWPLLERYPDVTSRRIRVLYSSQNVELHLNGEILRRHGIDAAPDVLAGLERLERSLVAHADATIACTEADAEVFLRWGARRVVVAPNGGVRRQRGHLRAILPEPLRPDHVYALVVGSNHHPNVSGFLDLVTPWLPRLRPMQRVVIAGDAGPSIMAEMGRTGLGQLARDRVLALGRVDGFSLDCAIANARAILVPVRYGGGSNVKTAEALLSGRPIIASPCAMRGFGMALGAPGLHVADTAEDFGAAVLGLLDRPGPGVPAGHPALAALAWDATVAPVVALLRDIAHADAMAVGGRASPPDAGRASAE